MLNQKTYEILDHIKNDINNKYGFHDGIPKINYGPCGVFAKVFFDEWNNRFKEKCHICFILTTDRNECDHIVIRLPSGELYDGGIGVHTDNEYKDTFIIEDMINYDETLLDKWSYGLDRTYPRFCPDFEREFIENVVHSNLERLRSNDNKPPMVIRELVASDIEACVQLFYDTIHAVNAKDYTAEQLDAWAPSTTIATDPRCQTILNNIAYVVEINKMFVGFGDMTKQGYLDRLYVHHNYQRQGVASAIVNKLIEDAYKLGLAEITTHSSITAKPFFESFGFIACQQQEVDLSGVKLVNFIMKKTLK